MAPPIYDCMTYVILDPRWHRLKVGTAPDASKKFNAFRATCSYDPVLLYALPGDHVERIVGAFADRALHNDWFDDVTGEIRLQLERSLGTTPVERSTEVLYRDAWEPDIKTALERCAFDDGKHRLIAVTSEVYRVLTLDVAEDRVRFARVARSLGWQNHKMRIAKTASRIDLRGAHASVWYRPIGSTVPVTAAHVVDEPEDDETDTVTVRESLASLDDAALSARARLAVERLDASNDVQNTPTDAPAGPPAGDREDGRALVCPDDCVYCHGDYCVTHHTDDCECDAIARHPRS